MYSVMLATMLTAGAQPATTGHWFSHCHHGCHSCHSSCAFSCHSYCHGCCSYYHGCNYCHSFCSCSTSWWCHGCSSCHCCSSYVVVLGSHCHGCCSYYPSWCHGCCSSGVVWQHHDPVGDEVRKVRQQAADEAERNYRKKLDAKKGKGAKKDDEQASISSTKARLVVSAPADARLWVDQVECPLPGTVRSFETPNLNPDQAYTYTLRVAVERNGETVEETRRVRFTPGEEVAVDFTRVGVVRTASTDE